MENKNFTEEVSFEHPLNLIIIPVEIRGRTYRFLFDTGAPNVISEELQEEYNFKTIAKNNIRDSEKKVKKVTYVSVENIKIGNIQFENTAAFITDLKANPVLDCLGLDGIIGANLMRFCVWRVDYSTKKLTLTDQPEQLENTADYHEISFQSNSQYNIKIDFKTPNATINNLKIDYGSTGSIGIPNKPYNILKSKGEFSEEQVEAGFSQSGIFGDFLVDTTKSSVIQFGEFGDFKVGKTAIENEGKGLLGTEILKNYVVTMNWQKQTIGFDRTGMDIKFQRNEFGFSPAFRGGKTIVKSTIIGGSAMSAGLKPKMRIHSINDFKFENLEDFCAYVLREKIHRDTLTVKAFEGDVLKTFEIKRK